MSWQQSGGEQGLWDVLSVPGAAPAQVGFYLWVLPFTFASAQAAPGAALPRGFPGKLIKLWNCDLGQIFLVQQLWGGRVLMLILPPAMKTIPQPSQVFPWDLSGMISSCHSEDVCSWMDELSISKSASRASPGSEQGQGRRELLPAAVPGFGHLQEQLPELPLLFPMSVMDSRIPRHFPGCLWDSQTFPTMSVGSPASTAGSASWDTQSPLLSPPQPCITQLCC